LNTGCCTSLLNPSFLPRVLIISPALANANNGNWQTAWRWRQMLKGTYQTHIAQKWDGTPFDVMLALHARRSADSIARWAKVRGATSNAPGLGVVLTGTDLYRDIQTDTTAQTSLALASRLVVLQNRGPDVLPADLRHKAQVIFQSTSSRLMLGKTQRHVRAVMVGHLRDEKSPQTLFEVAHLLKNQPKFLLDHIGEPLDAALGAQARATALACPHYRWLGGLAHEATRRHIQRAHVLIHASRMEGGAHVVMEAICSGTPVLASRIDGNVGMLGADYPGYFEHGDAQGLANLLLKFPQVQADLLAHCAARAPLFSPEVEQASLVQLVNDLATSCHEPY
jgi:putative glycosyltransferase (TIGR04348 family)